MSDIERLSQLELRIEGAFWDMCGALFEIEQNGLYQQTYATWSEYLLKRWPGLASPNTWRQWRASYKAHLLASESGVSLTNEHAARALRRVERSARALVVQKARQYTGKSELSAADILPVAEVVRSVLDEAAVTGGYVDTGDGSMTALEAAVDAALQERVLRQRQHIADSVRNHWSDALRFPAGQIWTFTLNGVLAAIDLTALPSGAQIEFRWRLADGSPT